MLHTGIVDRSTIVKIWKIAGFPEAEILLSDLGLNSAYINLANLMNILCDELKSISDPEHLISAQVLLKEVATLLEQQFQSVDASLKNLRVERDNLRCDVEEANERANALTQELDEFQASHEDKTQSLLKQAEKVHANAIKDLTDKLKAEHKSEILSKEDRIQALQEKYHKLKMQFADLMIENQQLEVENDSLLDLHSKLMKNNDDLLQQMKILADEHVKIQEAERIRHEEMIFFQNKFKQLEFDYAVLRDQNDELAMELESMKNSNDNKKKLDMFLNSSIKSYPVDKDLSIKNAIEFALTNLEESDEESHVSSFDANIILSDLKSLLSDDLNNLRNRIFNFLNEFDSNTYTDSSHGRFSLKFRKAVIRTLKQLLANKFLCIINKLELTQNEMNLASEVEISLNSNRNSSLNLVSHVTTKGNQEQEQKKEKEQKPEGVTEKSKERHISSELNSVLINDNSATSLGDGVSPSREDSTDEKAKVRSDNNRTTSSSIPMELESEKISKKESVSMRNYPPKKVAAALAMAMEAEELEKKRCKQNITAPKEKLDEAYAELQKSLMILTNKYEAREDYWMRKLEEERQVFEEERQVFEQERQIFEQERETFQLELKDNEETLIGLIVKITEYEEVIYQQNKASNRSILSPIEERFSLELQYFDLELELEKCKITLGSEIVRLNKENQILREKLELQMRNVDRTVIAAQISDNKLTTRNHTLDNDHSPTNSLHMDYFVHLEDIGETDNPDDFTHFQVPYGTRLSNTDSSLWNFEAENRVVENSKEAVSMNQMDVDESHLFDHNQLELIENFYIDVDKFNAIKDNVDDLHDPTYLNYLIRRLPRYHSPASSSSSSKTNNTGNGVHEDPTHQLLKKKNKDINVKKLTDAMRKQLMNPQDNSDNLNQKDMINILNGIDESMQVLEKKYKGLYKLFLDQQEDFHNSTRYTWSQHKVEMSKLKFQLQNSQLKYQNLKRKYRNE